MNLHTCMELGYPPSGGATVSMRRGEGSHQASGIKIRGQSTLAAERSTPRATRDELLMVGAERQSLSLFLFLFLSLKLKRMLEA